MGTTPVKMWHIQYRDLALDIIVQHHYTYDKGHCVCVCVCVCACVCVSVCTCVCVCYNCVCVTTDCADCAFSCCTHKSCRFSCE